jgi:hypothetical protein
MHWQLNANRQLALLDSPLSASEVMWSVSIASIAEYFEER